MRTLISLLLLFIVAISMEAQPMGSWHDKERELRYTPEGEDFVIVNGDRKFNRALYGTNTAFRIETGDLPEFGLFMPHMGGNIQLGILSGGKSLWLNDAEYVKSVYRAGSRIYEIKDPLLGSGKLTITALALADAEGIILRVEANDVPEDATLVTLYGGASNRRFSRNGDLGVDDPDAFALKAEGCEGNRFVIRNESFRLTYGEGTRGGPLHNCGLFSKGTTLKLGSPYSLNTVSALSRSSATDNRPLLVAQSPLSGDEVYIVIKGDDGKVLTPEMLPSLFEEAEQKRRLIAGTVRINTPDPYFNPLGGVLSIAADGIWDEETAVWQHGAVGWRMPLNGWRAAYTGDAIGWHDRAREHFNGYAASQVTGVKPVIAHPAQDTVLNLTRAEKRWGTQMYSDGYISRNPRNNSQMHHYDMNLVYIDELLWHFNWTGDMDYVKEMWPVLQRHLAWEKRNYDPNDDGLYDAYACIWASDALQYNSGSVTYSSAYNYRANRMAAMIAEKIGEDPKPYKKEAEKILKAINSTLWLPHKGWWAEYKDLMGAQMIHPMAGLWTVYHAIDSRIHTPFQAYQATRYVDTSIPRIPVRARRLEDEGYYTLSTTNWLPYSWSVNNVAFAEVGHTSLAYWQAGRSEEAFRLFKSNILDGMYLGASPGNIGQVSFYDAARGECYRDFGDPVGVYSRTLIQGLFGILPDAMNERLVIRPGLPADWDYASLETRDIAFDFRRVGQTDRYNIKSSFTRKLALTLQLHAPYDRIGSITVNGRKVQWNREESVGAPVIAISCGSSDEYLVEIDWKGTKTATTAVEATAVQNEVMEIPMDNNVRELYDPQKVLEGATTRGNIIRGTVRGEPGHRTLFARVKEGEMEWWRAVDIEVIDPFELTYDPEDSLLSFRIRNQLHREANLKIRVNGELLESEYVLSAGALSPRFDVPAGIARFGTNRVELLQNNEILLATSIVNWNLKNKKQVYETIPMDSYMNASVHQVFTNEYLSPRPPFTTLQIPKQGIGEWCHPSLTAAIDDSGLRKASRGGIFETPFGIPFRTPSDDAANIAFTSLWDNYPSAITIPLAGKASHVYLLMAGSTNHMQVHVPNGEVMVTYRDGSVSRLELRNPETWVPIEQDLFVDDHAFKLSQPRPYRVALKTGKVSRIFDDEVPVEEVYGRSIDGGAGIILDLPLDKNKELEDIVLKTIANEVVIGLMSVTLVR